MIYLKCTVIHRTTRDGQVQQRVVIVKNNLSKVHSNTQNNT